MDTSVFQGVVESCGVRYVSEGAGWAVYTRDARTHAYCRRGTIYGLGERATLAELDDARIEREIAGTL